MRWMCWIVRRNTVIEVNAAENIHLILTHFFKKFNTKFTPFLSKILRIGFPNFIESGLNFAWNIKNISGIWRNGLRSCKCKERFFKKNSVECVKKKYFTAFIAFHICMKFANQMICQCYPYSSYNKPIVFFIGTGNILDNLLVTSRFPGWSFWLNFYNKCGECGELL